MADVTVTPAEVLKKSGATTREVTAGATITAGQPVYLDANDDSQAKPADADASLAAATVAGIALHAAVDEQPLTIATGGTIDPGFTVTVGEIYMLSGTAGGIAPVADYVTADYCSILGYGVDASTLQLLLENGGILHA